MATLKETKNFIFGNDKIQSSQIFNERSDLESKVIFDSALTELVKTILQSVTQGKKTSLSIANSLLVLEFLGELSQIREKYLTEISRHEVLSASLREAHARYTKADRADKGAMDALRALGWKHKERVSNSVLFYEYMELLFDFEDDPIPTEALREKALSQEKKMHAIEVLREKYEMASYQAAYKRIQRAVRFMKNKHGEYGGYNNLLPANWPDSKH